MQLFGFFGLIALVGVMWLAGFQIVPESATNQASASGAGLIPAGITTRSSTDANLVGGSSVAQTATPQAAVTVSAPQNIEVNSALLRGSVAVGSESFGETFFIYGYNQTALDRSLGTADSYQQVLDNLRPGVTVNRVATRVTRDQDFSTRVSSLAPDSTYYVRLCAQRVGGLTCSTATSLSTIPGAYRPRDVQIPTIRITDQSAQAADELILDLTVSMRDSVDGTVYLIYGESRSQVAAAIDQAYRQIDEDDEQLQTTRIARNLRGTQRLRQTVDDLREDRMIYYAVCVAYDGLLDGTVCTRLQTYQTYSEDFGKQPNVQTSPVAFSGTTARLAGSVRMLDFNDGKVFFVYGTDASRIAAIGGETSMERLRQTQDRFQRVLVDSDLDGTDTYTQTVRDLLPDTSYTARLCVEYDNQNDRYRDVAFVACGATQSFVTQ